MIPWKTHTFFSLIRWFVDDCTMLQTPEIEHTHTAIGAAADENIDALGAETDVVDFLVVSNELCLGCQCRDIPDSAGRVNARGNDETW